MFSGKSTKTRLLFITILLAMVFVLVRPVQAALLPVPLPTYQPVTEVKQSIGATIAASLYSGLSYFLNKIAYDTATWLAAGGKGQSPMWWEKPGEYFQKAGEEAAADAIFALGDNIAFLKKYKISLCVPPEPKFQMWLKLAVTESTFPPVPRCNFKEIKQAWSRIDEPGYWRQVGVGFKPGQNELSVLLGASSAVKEATLLSQAQLEKEIGKKGETKSPENKVTGEATAPQEMGKAEAEKKAPSAATEQQQQKLQSMTWGLAMGNLGGAFVNAGSLFVNTLAQKLGERLMKKGFASLADLMKGGAAPTAEGQAVGGRQIAEAAFAEFLKPNLPAVEQYPYVADLAGDCDDNPSPYCGALDSSLQTALDQASAGSPLTVKEAMDMNPPLLHANWLLKKNCQKDEKEAYCYENLVKLRIFRILPLGWEIAANLSPEDTPDSLETVVNAFYTQGSKYYHLIDPNWLLKAPIASCGAMAYGAGFLIPPAEGSPGQRQEYCAEVKNCVDEKEGNICQEGLWGYCLREKNLWRLGGDECDEQFNTCSAYTNSDGKTTAYLANTIDKGLCSADNAGCRAYATDSAWNNNQWQWQVGETNPKIYFNDKKEDCDYANEGCNQFVRTGSRLKGGEILTEVAGQEINLKKAPDYYHCYDGLGVTFSSGTLPWWPVNKTDLVKLADSLPKQNKESCQKFAQVCAYDEVGCELYTPADNTPAIPGILTENDLCPAECAGYESFKQQKTNFEAVAPAGFAYFIPAPAKAQSCQSNYAGCDEFINLEKQEKGGESKEYYTELRACSQNEAEGAVYYTWEGSDTAGYQLKSYSLKTLKTLKALNTLKGLVSLNNYTTDENAPAYHTDNEQNLLDYLTACNAEKYKAHTADVDCREFYDKDGNKSYRLYTKTITVSASECKKLRKSVSDKDSCDGTGGGWDDKQKICIYLAIPAEGKPCPAQQNGCREYLGNAGHNFQIIYQENFEGGAIGSKAKDSTGWDGTFSAESTVVGGKSLKADKTTQTITTLPKGATFLISFWAKGTGPNLQVGLFASNQSPIFNIPPYPISSEWKNYTAGPFTVDWDGDSKVVFQSNGLFFLDNLVVKQMKENIYVIKDSWQTPSSCDNVLGDPYGESQGGSSANPYRLLPQAMLGCNLYKNRQGDEATVKSFTQMCREEAVGCEEFVDTFNTAASEDTFVNVLCELSATSTSNQAISCKDKKGQEKCNVLPNQKSCRFTLSGKNGLVPSSGLFADLTGGTTKSAEGEEKNNKDESYNPITIKKDSQTITIPADRKEYLVNDNKYYCSEDNLGCQALGPVSYDADGSPTVGANNYSPLQVYLKNQPDNYSKILCEKAEEGCEEFKTSQGGLAYFKDPEIWGDKICEWRENVLGAFMGWWLKGEDYDPCYTNFTPFTGYSINGIWRTGDVSKYQGKVGLCPIQQDTCSEFIDPAVTTPTNPEGAPYYVLNNDKLDRASCAGQVSQPAGCILFNETSKGTLSWNTAATYNYSASPEKNYAKVNPIDCGAKGEKGASDNKYCVTNDASDKNNANTILKVQRDRVCGQWLACKSSMAVPDPASPNGFKEVCTELAVCDQTQPSTSLLGRCSHWVEDAKVLDPVKKGKIFTKDKYITRDVSFAGQDFSGYSLYDGYQIADLSTGEAGNQKGLTGPDKKSAVFANETKAIPESCRGYASADAPANYCSFTKVTYSGKGSESQTKYYAYNHLFGGEGVCDSGWFLNEKRQYESKQGETCFSSADCRDERQLTSENAYPEDGVCLLQKEVSRSRGWEGYCLDSSSNVILSEAKNPLSNKSFTRGGFASGGCALWYPLSNPSGSVSLDNLFETAGYVPPEGAGKYWCVQGKGNSNRAGEEASYKFTALTDNQDIFPRTPDWNGKCTLVLWNWCDKATNQDDVSELSLPTSKLPSLHYSEITAVSLQPKRWYDGKDWPTAEMLIFPNQRLAGIRNGGGDGDDGYFWSGPLKQIGNVLVLDLVWREGKGSQIEMSYESLNQNFCDQFFGPIGGNALALRMMFDPNGKLQAIKSKICDRSSSDGGFSVDLNFYLTEVCSDIRQVVDNTNQTAQDSPMGFLAKARTDRIWSLSGYSVGGDLRQSTSVPKPTPLDTPYNQLFAPFGSFNQSVDPVTSSLSKYLEDLKIKSDYEKIQIAKKAGYWPIWMSAGGATPLNCAGENGGDCGKINLCEQASPNAGTQCQPDDWGYSQTCQEEFQNKCDTNKKVCKDNTNNHFFGKCQTSDDCLAQSKSLCKKAGYCDKPGQSYVTQKSCWIGSIGDEYCVEELGPGYTCRSGMIGDFSCYNADGSVGQSCTPGTTKCASNNLTCEEIKTCSQTGDICSQNSNCSEQYPDCPLKECWGFGSEWTGTRCNSNKDCLGKQSCEINTELCTGLIPHQCSGTDIRGLCVGGVNHGLPCGSSKDCPEKKYQDSVGETVEYGVCVGSALDSGQTIPQSAPGRAYERMFELFVQNFGTWCWSDNSYKKSKSKISGGTFACTGWSDLDYSDGKSYDDPPASNKSATISPKPPQIFSLKDDGKGGFTWEQANHFTVNGQNSGTIDGGSGSFTALLRFFAFADNDQMPLVRMAVDWGDGEVGKPNVYEVKGWFKNRKPECGDLICENDPSKNVTCQTENSSNECAVVGGGTCKKQALHFGNSNDACQTGYYQFTHIYICPKDSATKLPTCSTTVKSNCWNGTVCVFKPKVQVLDNWGWCNGDCKGAGKGCWDDSKLVGTDEPKRECNTQNDKSHWTKFDGTIEIKP